MQNSEEPVLNTGKPTEWEWTVTPLQSGPHKLKLIVIPKVLLPSYGVKSCDAPGCEEIINVEVNPRYVLSSFIHANWKWLWTAIAAPLFIWYYNQYMKGRKKRYENPDHD